MIYCVQLLFIYIWLPSEESGHGSTMIYCVQSLYTYVWLPPEENGHSDIMIYPFVHVIYLH